MKLEITETELIIHYTMEELLQLLEDWEKQKEELIASIVCDTKKELEKA